MKLAIKNSYLAPSIEFLLKLELRKEESRSRSRLVKLLQRKLEELLEDDERIIKEYANLDGNGEPIILGKTYDIPEDKKAECGRDRTILRQEQAVMECGEYPDLFQVMHRVLNDYDGTLSGKDAEAYDEMLEAFERGDNNGKHL